MVIVRVAQQQQAACVFRAGLHQSLELSTNLRKVSQCLEKIIFNQTADQVSQIHIHLQ